MHPDDWRPDESKFKVICQKCGKTGTVDFEKPEQDFIESDIESSKGYEYDYGIWLCRNRCFFEVG